MHRTLRPLSLALFVVLMALVSVGCDGAEDEGPAGTYAATRFVVEPDGEGDPLDVLAGGGSLTLTLRDDRTFSGALFVPASIGGEPDEGDLDEAFSGTYTIQGETVTFSTGTDVFVADATWTLRGDRLSTAFEFGDDGVIHVELER